MARLILKVPIRFLLVAGFFHVAVMVAQAQSSGSINLGKKQIFLISYFTKQEGGACLALSNDGLHWVPLNEGKPVIRPEVGEEKLMRDPSIHHGKDGIYRMVWTTGWKGKGIGYASSTDLLHWSQQTLIPVGAKIDSSSNCWAPEIFYDDKRKQYMIYWSSNVGEWSKQGSEGRIYYVTTKDFNHFSDPMVLFKNGFPAGGEAGNDGPIDAYIYKDKNRYLLFYKKDVNTKVPNLYYRAGKTATGPWEEENSPLTPSTGDEGPSVQIINGRYCVFTDPAESEFAYMFSSRDWINWTRSVTDLRMSHGTVIRISPQTAQALLRHQ